MHPLGLEACSSAAHVPTHPPTGSGKPLPRKTRETAAMTRSAQVEDRKYGRARMLGAISGPRESTEGQTGR